MADPRFHSASGPFSLKELAELSGASIGAGADPETEFIDIKPLDEAALLAAASALDDEDALAHADRIVREDSMADLLGQVDALHVLTSLSGFEALLRGLEVTCHGTPFFAGWGLTRDMAAPPGRRRRTLSLDELVAGVLLLYPRYLDPVTGLPCPPEVLVQRMAQGQMPNRLSWVEPLRRAQGKIAARWRKQGKERGTA